MREVEPVVEQLMTAAEVAEQLQVPVSWVESRARRGQIPSRKIGRYRRFTQVDVDDFIESVRQADLAHRANPLALSPRSLAMLRSSERRRAGREQT